MAMSAPKKLIERLGVAAELPFPIHTHMLRHAAGYALAGRGMSPTSLDRGASVRLGSSRSPLGDPK